MRSWMMRGCVLGVALILAAPATAAAQGTLGVGVSFLGDEGGTGVTVDYSRPIRSLANDRTLGWVGDFSYHRNGFGNDFAGVDGNFTTMTFQGGVRLSGQAAPKVSWHAQGLVGVRRSSFDVSASGLTDEICDAFDIDCSVGDSDTGVIFTPGAGIDYMLTERAALRAQLDIPIGEGGSTTRVWFGVSFKTRE
jgi:hypothetical protein